MTVNQGWLSILFMGDSRTCHMSDVRYVAKLVHDKVADTER